MRRRHLDDMSRAVIFRTKLDKFAAATHAQGDFKAILTRMPACQLRVLIENIFNFVDGRVDKTYYIATACSGMDWFCLVQLDWCKLISVCTGVDIKLAVKFACDTNVVSRRFIGDCTSLRDNLA